jgi:hypothetical protein
MIGIVEQQGKQVVNVQFSVVFTALNVPQQLPNFVVPPGAAVYLRGCAGLGVNVGLAYVGRSRDALLGIGAVPPVASFAGSTVIQSNTQVGYPCSNLNQLWACGQLNDGLQVSILGWSMAWIVVLERVKQMSIITKLERLLKGEKKKVHHKKRASKKRAGRTAKGRFTKR